MSKVLMAELWIYGFLGLALAILGLLGLLDGLPPLLRNLSLAYKWLIALGTSAIVLFISWAITRRGA